MRPPATGQQRAAARGADRRPALGSTPSRSPCRPTWRAASTEPARALAALAADVAARPRLRLLVEESAPVADVLALDAHFAASFAAYLGRYGCRLLSYEFAERALDERPELVLALLRDQLSAGYDPAARDRQLVERRAAAAAEARAALAGRDAADRERFETALARAVEAYPVREDNEFYAVSARRSSSCAGSRSSSAGG